MNLQQRFNSLKAQLNTEPVIHYFASGSRREWRGRDDYMLGHLQGACAHRELNPDRSAELDLIRQSIHSEEPGATRIIELIRAFLDRPAKLQPGYHSSRPAGQIWTGCIR